MGTLTRRALLLLGLLGAVGCAPPRQRRPDLLIQGTVIALGYRGLSDARDWDYWIHVESAGGRIFRLRVGNATYHQAYRLVGKSLVLRVFERDGEDWALIVQEVPDDPD